MISEKHYKRLIEPHRRALEKLRLELEFFLEDVGTIDIYKIQSRIKFWESASRKSSVISVPIEELDDIAGLQVIVGTQNEIPVLERFLTRQEYGNDLKILKKHKLYKPDGYRALHIVVELKGHYQTSIYPGRVEIQLQTVFEHAFNFLSRSWKYKQQHETSSAWDDRFVQLSEKLRAIENDASELHTHLTKFIIDDENSLLTPHSYKILVQQEFGEDGTLSDAVDSCRFYSGIGYKTNGQLRQFFQNPEIQDLYNRIALNQSNQAIRHILRMGKTGFWILFGTRRSTPGLIDFFDALMVTKDKADES